MKDDMVKLKNKIKNEIENEKSLIKKNVVELNVFKNEL